MGKRTLKSLFETLATNPLSLLNTSTDDNFAMFGYPFISECACFEFGRNSSSKREQFEDRLVEAILQNFDNAKQITIVSVGCGGCFQELVIHAKLHRRNKALCINWILIDPLLFKYSLILQSFGMLVTSITPKSRCLALYDADQAVGFLRNGNIAHPHVFLSIDSRLQTLFCIDELTITTKMAMFFDELKEHFSGRVTMYACLETCCHIAKIISSIHVITPQEFHWTHVCKHAPKFLLLLMIIFLLF